MKSHGSGQEVSEKKLGTFTRLLIPTEDQKNGAEGCFLVFLVWTIFMRVVVVSSVSVASRRSTTYTASYSTPTLSNNLVTSIYGLRTLDPVRN